MPSIIKPEQYERVRLALKKGRSMKSIAEAENLHYNTVMRVKYTRGYVEYKREAKNRTHRIYAYREMTKLKNEVDQLKHKLNLAHQKIRQDKEVLERHHWWWPF